MHSLCEEIGFHPPLIKEVNPVFLAVEELRRRGLALPMDENIQLPFQRRSGNFYLPSADPLPKGLRFASVTYRIFKPSHKASTQKAATYNGKLLNCFDTWDFTHDLVFKVGLASFDCWRVLSSLWLKFLLFRLGFQETFAKNMPLFWNLRDSELNSSSRT